MDALIYILPPAIFAEEAGPEAGWGVGRWPFTSRMKSKSATGYFSNDVIDDIGIRHDLVSVFRFVEALACLRTVENQHCAFGGNLKFLRKLHYYARDFPVKYIIFHRISSFMIMFMVVQGFNYIICHIISTLSVKCIIELH